MILSKINQSVNQQSYINHFEKIFNEHFTITNVEDNSTSRFQPHTLQYKIEYANADRTIVFELRLTVNTFNLSHPASPIPLGLENLKIDTNIHTNILYKSKDIKLVKKTWGNTKGLQELKTPDKVFPAKTINARISKHKDKPLKKKDIITRLKMQYKMKPAGNSGDVMYLMNVGEDVRVYFDRRTFMGKGTWTVFIHSKENQQRFKSLQVKYISIFEDNESMDLFFKMIDEFKKAKNEKQVLKIYEKYYKSIRAIHNLK